MADTSFTVVTGGPWLFRRGDYISVSGQRACRITDITDSVLTTRYTHWRPIEWVRARWENWVQWPLRDRLERQKAVEQLLRDL